MLSFTGNGRSALDAVRHDFYVALIIWGSSLQAGEGWYDGRTLTMLN